MSGSVDVATSVEKELTHGGQTSSTDPGRRTPGTPVTAPDVGVADVVAVLLRRWRVIATTTVLTTALAGAVAVGIPDDYSATATVVVSPLVNDPSATVSSRDPINIATEREIVQSKEVARLALEQVGRPAETSGELISSMRVVAPDGSQVLHVTVTAGAPEEAAELANAVADGYLEFRRRGGQEVANRFMEHIDQRVAGLATGTPDDTTDEQIRLLTDQRSSLALFGQDPGRVIARAAPPRSPSGPGLAVFLLGGAAGGGLLGTGLALLRERVDRRVRSARRYEEDCAHEPVLLSGPTDEESMRWLWRTVASMAPPSGLILLLGLSGRDLGVAGPLADVARRAGYVVTLADATRMSPAEMRQRNPEALGPVDDGFDADRHLNHSAPQLRLVDATQVRSRTSIAELVDVADVVVLVATPRDLRSQVQQLSGLVAQRPVSFIPVLLDASTAEARR